jgi:hypothetical protein
MAASSVLMIEPKNFITNPQTVGDNFFQAMPADTPVEEINAEAEKEFFSLKEKLESNGIEVVLFSQDDKLQTPDAIFPNNWFSTGKTGTLILYPMRAENRRPERRINILNFLKNKYPLHIDLTRNEDKGLYLEGTGSLVLDHENRIAYASLSERTSSNLLFEWGRLAKYELVLFSSYDKNEKAVYHTNVVMSLADKFAIVCLDAITGADDKRRVKTKLEETNHHFISITREQMHHYCGNCLELQDNKGKKFLVMSDDAFTHFTEQQLQAIQTSCSIIHVNLGTIEKYGGGGARCMLAELF